MSGWEIVKQVTAIVCGLCVLERLAFHVGYQFTMGKKKAERRSRERR